MDLIQDLIEKHGAKFAALLTSRAGLEPEQAERFVPAGVGALVEQLRSGKLDLGRLVSGSGLGELLSRVDTAALARRTEVGEPAARSALGALAPAVLEALQGEAGGLAGLASLLGRGGEAGGLLSAAKRLLGR